MALRAEPGTVPPPPPTMRLQRMLVLALFGGLILNLMPCVFPVLALKVVGLAGMSGGRARAQAAAYTAGVLVAFAALGAALLAARAAGSAAGWGFQFQSPVFVAAMAWLLFAVGLNLSGVYQVGTGLMRTGHGLATRPGQLGSFFTGLLAVVVATPCTAPFMGVAIAAGLAAPPGVTMLVFLAMGLGFAAPYALAGDDTGAGPRDAEARPLDGGAAAGPGLPDVRRERLAGVGGQPGGRVDPACWALRPEWCCSVLLAGCSDSRKGAADRSRRIGQSAAAAALLAALAVLSGIASAPLEPLSVAAGSGAEPFTAARLAALRAEGQPVFVDMTAAWCVTCLVNERVAIDTNTVRQAFADHHVTYLKGDWTRQDPHITNYLRENGREGVPLYVYYPAERPAFGAAANTDREYAAERTRSRLRPGDSISPGSSVEAARPLWRGVGAGSVGRLR